MLIGWARLHYAGFPPQTDFEKEFQKIIASEFDLNAVIKNIAMQQSAVFQWKSNRIFSDQKRIDSQPEKSLSGVGWCRTMHTVTELHGCQTER